MFGNFSKLGKNRVTFWVMNMKWETFGKQKFEYHMSLKYKLTAQGLLERKY